MVIAGYDGSKIDDVELVSLDPILQPLPECLTELNPFPLSVSGLAGALDYSSESDYQEYIDATECHQAYQKFHKRT